MDIRKRQQDKEKSMKKTDKKAELIKKIQRETDRRTQVENEAIRLIENCEFEKARRLLETINDDIVKEIERELDDLDREEGSGHMKAEGRQQAIEKDMIAGDFLLEENHRDVADLEKICRGYAEAASDGKK